MRRRRLNMRSQSLRACREVKKQSRQNRILAKSSSPPLASLPHRSSLASHRSGHPPPPHLLHPPPPLAPSKAA